MTPNSGDLYALAKRHANAWSAHHAGGVAALNADDAHRNARQSQESYWSAQLRGPLITQTLSIAADNCCLGN